MDQREAIANLLMEHCKNDAAQKVEKCLESGDSYSWRDILRFEFDTETITETLLRYDVVLPKLMLYEIRTISPFHYAALRGNRDIMVCFLDKDLPVDMALKSGTTALHIACFSGNAELVKLLVDVYKADLSKQDNYGWSALHYAGTQGQVEVVHILLENGIDVNLRDKDGTSAAFRAQVNGHENVVSAICDEGDEDELMNIYERVGAEAAEAGGPGSQNRLPNPKDIYAVPNKGRFAKENQATRSKSVSDAAPPAAAASDEESNGAQTLPAHHRMPKHMQLEHFRDIIQSVMSDDDYMSPREVAREKKADPSPLAGIGRNTLRGVLREEIQKHMQQLFTTKEEHDPLARVVPVTKDGTYEDLYASIANFGHAPTPPPVTPGNRNSTASGPPLPPRNSSYNSLNRNNGGQDYYPGIQLPSTESSNAALIESFKKLAPRLGSDWKKLAAELPIESSKSKTNDRIKAIEKKYAGDQEKQATVALVEWSLNKRQDADVDNLILALRRCNMYNIIEVVEKVTQEFTA